MKTYILNDQHEPVPTDDARVWGEWMEKGNRQVARTEIDGVSVSTVFLGLDHQWGEGRPILFETMIFGGKHNEYQRRCSTWHDAEVMHKEAVNLVRNTPKEKA